MNGIRSRRTGVNPGAEPRLSSSAAGRAFLAAETSAAEWALLATDAGQEAQFRARAMALLGLTIANIKTSYRTWGELSYASLVGSERQVR